MSALKTLFRPLYHSTRAAWLRGNARFCPLCGGSFRRFLPKSGRRDAQCPGCLSLERHRLLWLFLSRKERLGESPLSLLHFAPEEGIRKRLERLPGLRYVTADIAAGRGSVATRFAADLGADITRLPVRAASLDRVLCCHVLEHVPDDATAMRELFRVLKPGGRAILQVPLRDGPTDEDLSITDPAERLRRYGLEDHVRLYGREDFARRLEAAGFRVEAVSGTEGIGAGEIARGRLLAEGNHEDLLFVAQRGAL